MSRRTYHPEEKSILLQKFTRFTGSAAAFCREHDLPYLSFLQWKRDAADAATAPSEFLTFTLQSNESVVTPQVVEFDFGNGLVVRIPFQGTQP